MLRFLTAIIEIPGGFYVLFRETKNKDVNKNLQTLFQTAGFAYYNAIEKFSKLFACFK